MSKKNIKYPALLEFLELKSRLTNVESRIYRDVPWQYLLVEFNNRQLAIRAYAKQNGVVFNQAKLEIDALSSTAHHERKPERHE